MKDPSEADYVVCLSAKQGQHMTLHPGSTKETCSKCQEEVCISPASVKMRAAKLIPILCTDCAFKAIKEDQKPEIMITPEIAKEVVAKLNSMQNRQGGA